MFKILIGDDHAIIRKGLRQILREEISKCEIDEAADGMDVIQKINEKQYDILILDISMPKRNGIDLLNQLKIEKPEIPILILSIHPEEQYAIRVLKAGAAGFINKASAPEELVHAIRKITEGGKYISPVVAEQLATNILNSGQAPHEHLSDREFQVMLMIASGNTTKEIAEELSLSVKTISTYRARLLEKMELENNAKLTKYVLQHNLL
jgi:two-component system, NarL family, invasion response regulator UvrY